MPFIKISQIDELTQTLIEFQYDSKSIELSIKELDKIKALGRKRPAQKIYLVRMFEIAVLFKHLENVLGELETLVLNSEFDGNVFAYLKQKIESTMEEIKTINNAKNIL